MGKCVTKEKTAFAWEQVVLQLSGSQLWIGGSTFVDRGLMTTERNGCEQQTLECRHGVRLRRDVCTCDSSSPQGPGSRSSSVCFLTGLLLQKDHIMLHFLIKCFPGLEEHSFSLGPLGRLAIIGNYICVMFSLYGRGGLYIVILNRVFKHVHAWNS